MTTSLTESRADAVVLAGTLAARLLYRADLLALPAVVDRLLGVVVLQQVFVIAWQWGAVPLRSDGYAVLANALGCRNLYRTSALTAKRRLVRLCDREEAELAAAGARDRSVARWFGAVQVAGILAMGWMFVSYGLPYLIAMLGWVLANVRSAQLRSAVFWESAAMLGYLLLSMLLPLVLAIRERRLRHRGGLL